MGYLFAFIVLVIVVYALSRSNSNSRKPQPVAKHRPDTLAFEVSIGGGYARGTSQLNWVGPTESLQLGRLTIPNAMTYTSKGAPRSEEASCIDTNLKVGVPVSEPKGALGYWPKYAEISPDQRANYLFWLAKGRREDLHDIGYAFIFFYGLERRVLIDRADIGPSIDEVLALLRRYPESTSFQSYLSKFLAYAMARPGLGTITANGFIKVFGAGSPMLFTEDTLAIALAWLQINQRPLPPELAYEVARLDGRSPRSVVLKRMPEEHRTLFTRKYTEMCGNGLALRAAKRESTVTYHSASPTMLSYRTGTALPPLQIPNVLGISSQFKGVVDIWAECVSELKGASTQVGKGLDVASREVYEKLPEHLRSNYDHPDKARWDELVAANTGRRGFAKVEMSALAELRDIAFRPKLTRAQSIDVARAAQQMNYALVPDPWSIQRPYVWNEKVAVVASDGSIDEESDRLYQAAALMLELGIGMAAADGNIDREEVVHISHVMRDHFRLPSEYARRLEVYRALLIKAPPTLNGLGKRIEGTFDEVGRTALARYLVGIAAVDGIIDPGERKALNRLYRALDVPLEKMEALLKELAVADSEPVVVKQGKPDQGGEPIPQPTAVALNTALVQQIMKDTADVATMIGKAMGEYDHRHDDEGLVSESEQVPAVRTDEEAPVGLDEESVGESASNKFEGLDPRYGRALEELTHKSEWTRAELEELARRYLLMPAGLIDEINDWADESLGDYLIDGDGPYSVRAELLGDTA
jgi:uncharacterized tellurite resistance protein B-like protein